MDTMKNDDKNDDTEWTEHEKQDEEQTKRIEHRT